MCCVVDEGAVFVMRGERVFDEGALLMMRENTARAAVAMWPSGLPVIRAVILYHSPQSMCHGKKQNDMIVCLRFCPDRSVMQYDI